MIDPKHPPDPRPPEAWSVSGIVSLTARTLLGACPDDMWVRGTISSWRPFRWRTFCELSEQLPGQDHPSGRLSVVMHRRTAEVIIEAAGLAPGETPVHLDVALGGRLSVNSRGAIELQAITVLPLASPSAASLSRDELRSRLAGDGRLDRQRTLTLVAEPRRIGLIAPSSGEAGRNNVLTGLPDSMVAVERRVAMEGAQAASAIARALNGLTLSGPVQGGMARGEVDLVLVIRGGGSPAELAPFDSELVASAIARSAVPVVVAIGHSTDHTLADEVVWRSLPTPSAASDWLAALADARVTAEIIDAAAQKDRDATAARQLARHHQLEAVTAKARYTRLHRRLVVVMVAAAAAAVLVGVLVGFLFR